MRILVTGGAGFIGSNVVDRFVELGQGTVDVPGVVAAVEDVGFRGPAVIELDRVPDPARTPKECAAINKQYAVGTLGLHL